EGEANRCDFFASAAKQINRDDCAGKEPDCGDGEKWAKMQPGACRHIGQCLPRRPPKICFAPLALVFGKKPRKRYGDQTDRDSDEPTRGGAEITQRIWCALENHSGPERKRAEHAQRVVILSLADSQNWCQHRNGPGHRESILETNLARPHYPPPGKDQRRQNRQRPGKPPGEMTGEKLPARNIVIPIPVRIAAQQMFNPLLSNNAMKRPIKMDFDPEIPRSDDGEKKQQVRPPKERAKPHPRLTIKDRQRSKG